MKLEAIVNQEQHTLEIEPRRTGIVSAKLNGHPIDAIDVRRVEDDVWSLIVDGQSYECTIQPLKNILRVTVRGATWDIAVYDPRRRRPEGAQGAGAEGRQVIASPMPGRVVRLEVAVGDKIDADQGIIVVEAMKMENELNSVTAGTVTEIKVEPGQTVEGDQPLVIIE